MATNSKSTELTVQEQQLMISNPSLQAIKKFELQQRMAQMYVQSTIIPESYRGNIGNCVIAIDMAQRMGANPLMVMQNLYIVHGNPGWSSKFLIACINMSGRFTPLRYQFYGKRGTQQYGCRAYAYEKSDVNHKDALCGIWITMDMAEKEGWTSKNGSKWRTMPDQMLMYRAAAFWQRAYAPEISMGFLTKEEIEDAVVLEEIPVENPGKGDEPVPEIDNLPEMSGDEGTGANTDEDKDANKTPYRAPESGAADAAPAPKKEEPKSPKDAIAEAMGRQSSAAEQARAIHDAYNKQKVDTETGEIMNDQETETENK